MQWKLGLTGSLTRSSLAHSLSPLMTCPLSCQEWCKNGSVFDIIRKAELELKDGSGPHCGNWQVVSCSEQSTGVSLKGVQSCCCCLDWLHHAVTVHCHGMELQFPSPAL